jgi:hypothetical protein
MELHELFSTVVEDLPEMTDPLPDVERSFHRRAARRRVGAVAVTGALVLGVGTVTIAAPWSRHALPPTQASVTAVPPSGDFPKQVIALLQPAWPAEGQTISWDPSAAASHASSTTYNEYYQMLAYKVTSAAGSYELDLRFFPDEAPVHPLPESTVCPPVLCTTAANGWQVDAPPDGDMRYGVVYVMDGSASIASIMLSASEKVQLDESQLRQLASSDTMRELYQLAVEDGMTVVPPST